MKCKMKEACRVELEGRFRPQCGGLVRPLRAWLPKCWVYVTNLQRNRPPALLLRWFISMGMKLTVLTQRTYNQWGWQSDFKFWIYPCLHYPVSEHTSHPYSGATHPNSDIFCCIHTQLGIKSTDLVRGTTIRRDLRHINTYTYWGMQSVSTVLSICHRFTWPPTPEQQNTR